MSAETTSSTAARAAVLERKLEARPAAEKAFFDGGWVSYPMLLMVALIGALELSANVRFGEGWSSLAHFMVIVPLEASRLSYSRAGYGASSGAGASPCCAGPSDHRSLEHHCRTNHHFRSYS